jgi:magnesium chelatase family protein
MQASTTDLETRIFDALMKGLSILVIGQPGSGKLLAVRAAWARIATRDARPPQDTFRIYRMAGLHTYNGALPFRAPHYTSSYGAIFGDSRNIHPGEVSLAHGGLLVLDEAPEFSHVILSELLRVRRVGEVRFSEGMIRFFPASFRLVAFANTCPCRAPRKTACQCKPGAKSRYHARVDRSGFDLVIEQ